MRFAAYCRVSTEHEEQLSSLENQKLFFEEYAQKTGDTLVKVYADEGISGKSMQKREAFNDLLKDAQTASFDYVAVKDISRFARNTSDFLYGIRTLKSCGTDVRFLSSNQTVLGESEFVLTVFAALAQQESENLSKRVIFGKQQNAKKGRVPNIVYGYDKIDTFTLKINPSESSVVKMIYRWYLDGDGTRRIAIKLNDMGIKSKKGVNWTPKTIRRILQNPIYTGKIINNKTVTQDFLSGTRQKLPESKWFIHDKPELRLISDEDFCSVQQKIEDRREQYKNITPGNRYSNRHLFSNLIKCGECGKSFMAKVYHWKNTYVRYRCCVHNNNGNAHCKNSVTIDENELLDEVKKYLISIIKDKQAFTEALKSQYVQQNEDVDFAYIEQTKSTLEKRRKKFKEMYVAGVIDIDELKTELSKIDMSIQELEDVLKKYDEVQDKINHAGDIADDAEEILMKNQYTNDDMRRLIEKIVVYPDKSVEIFMK